jgi:hypothetical protein
MPFRLLLLLTLLAPAVSAVEFHIATNGRDTDAGTQAKPFATIERARDAVRHLVRTKGMPSGGVVIQFHAGDYIRTNAIELTVTDSGSATMPIIWQAAKGEPVRLLGGQRLRGFETVPNSATLARFDEKARGHIVATDLQAAGITDFGEMKSRGFGRSEVAHGELFYDGKPMTLARWPNEGNWERIAGFPEASGQGDEHGGKIGKLEEGFNYAGDRPRRWQNPTNLWIHGYWAWDWANSYVGVASLDLENRLIKTVAPYGSYGFRKGQPFYFLNVLEELDQPGEWFLDRATGTLYFWPPKKLEAISEVLFSSLDEPLLKFNNVSHLVFRGFVLEATRGNAVEIRGGASNRIADCLIRNIGSGAVTIEGGYGHGIMRCEVFDTGDGGVSLQGGDRQTLTPGGHFVEDSHFARQGRWSKTYVPAVLMNGVGMRASHNLIHDHPHCAILFNGNDHLVEFNEIHHIALETGDVGAIYAGRDYSFRGNRIRHNFIHHTGGVGMGAMGVYMDDCVSGTEIFGNVFYKVQRAAFLGGGRDHQVVNNIFVDCNHAVELDGRGLDKTPVWLNMVDKTMRQRLTEVPLSLYRERYPALKSLDAHYGLPGDPSLDGNSFKGVPPEGNLVARNVNVGKWLNVYWHATLPMLQLENNLTDANPQFVGEPGDQAQAKDFALRPDSPAWKLDFERIPVEQIGPRK